MRSRRFRIIAGLTFVAGALIAGCSAPMVRQTAVQSAVHLDTPRSVSPASIPAPPMAHTAILPASAMKSATTRTAQDDIQGLNYTQVPGTATFAAAAPDGSLWVLSDQPAGPDKYIWHYSGGSWTNISGLASRLSVAPNGTLYAINSAGGAYAYISGVGTWTAFGGGCRDLSAAADGSLYVISNSSGSDGAIWQYGNGTWTQQPGSGNRIAPSWDTHSYSVPGGTITPGGYYVLNSQGSIYYLAAAGYVQLSGAASSAAPITGGLFALGYPTNANGNVLYYYNLDTPGWSAKGGSGVSISSDGKTLYIIAASGAIYSSAITPTSTVVLSPPGLSFLATGGSYVQTFTASQAGYTGPFTASAGTCGPYASVTPAQGTTFTVTPLAAGTCTMTVSGANGFSAPLGITVTVTVGSGS